MTIRRSALILVLGLTAFACAEAERPTLTSEYPETGGSSTTSSTLPEVTYPDAGPRSTSSSSTTTPYPVLSPTTIPISSWQPFEPLPAPPDVRPCELGDLWSPGTAALLDSPEDVRHASIIVYNLSVTPCALIGFTARNSGDDAQLPLGGLMEFDPADPVLQRGDSVSFVATSRYSEEQLGEDLVHAVLGLDGTDTSFWSGPIASEDAGFAGPVVWDGVFQLDVPKFLYLPEDPSSGTPLEQAQRITIYGLGALQPGMGLQEAADATGQPIWVSDYAGVSSGCGFARVIGVDVWLQLVGPSDSVADAYISAISVVGGWSTPSGLTSSSTYEEIIAALGEERLSLVSSEYDDSSFVLFTPADPADSHLGMAWGNSLTAGFAEGLIRQEGCA